MRRNRTANLQTWGLEPDLETPGEMRQAIQDVLAQWGVNGQADDIVLAASELMANAIVHGAPPISAALSYSGDTVVFSVEDHGKLLTISSIDRPETGHGIAIV